MFSGELENILFEVNEAIEHHVRLMVTVAQYAPRQSPTGRESERSFPR